MQRHHAPPTRHADVCVCRKCPGPERNSWHRLTRLEAGARTYDVVHFVAGFDPSLRASVDVAARGKLPGCNSSLHPAAFNAVSNGLSRVGAERLKELSNGSRIEGQCAALLDGVPARMPIPLLTATGTDCPHIVRCRSDARLRTLPLHGHGCREQTSGDPVFSATGKINESMTHAG